MVTTSVAMAAREMGERIRFAYQAKGLSRTEFSRQVGVKPNTIWCYEQGQSRPRPDTLVRISEVTGQSLEWLATGFDPRAQKPAVAGALPFDPFVTTPNELVSLRQVASVPGPNRAEAILRIAPVLYALRVAMAPDDRTRDESATLLFDALEAVVRANDGSKFSAALAKLMMDRERGLAEYDDDKFEWVAEWIAGMDDSS